VDFEFRQDEYHRHWATSIAETFDFHERAFADPRLDRVPESWNYSSPYRSLEVWGYRANVDADGAGFVYLEGVHHGGLRVTTRRWAPDGPAMERAAIHLTTAPVYAPGEQYKLLDYNFSSGHTRMSTVTADAIGRIDFTVNGEGHQISFAGPGISSDVPLLLPVTTSDHLRVDPGREIRLPVRIYNPRAQPVADVSVALSSEYPTVAILSNAASIPRIEPGGVANLTNQFAVKFTAGSGDFAPALLNLKISCDGGHERMEDIDVLVTPDGLRAPMAYQVLDGRKVTLPVFRQKGNQGGGASVQRTITEGKGNGNGKLEPGEEATIWVQIDQGLDPFDKNNWYRAKVYSDSPWVTEVSRLEEQKQLEWTSAKERTSVIRLAAGTPPGTEIPLLLSNESWSFTFTPDVRYGKERLYQAFQLHRYHLHRLTIIAGDAHPEKRATPGR